MFRSLAFISVAASDYGTQPPGSYNVKTDGSCVGDGVTDDTAALLAAFSEAGANKVYLPSGSYRAPFLTVPDGTKLCGGLYLGPASTDAWIQGQVTYGSGVTIDDLKIGPVSAGYSSARNSDGCDGATFNRDHFRGGGGTTRANYATMSIGDGNDVSNLAFNDCDWERSLGASWNGSGYAENTLSICAHGNTIDTVTLRGGTLGVTNGVATGAQRMMVECWTAQDSDDWWNNLTFHGVTFNASNIHQLDFACYGPGYTATPSGRGQTALVEYCTFMGGGVNEYGTGFGYGIVSESALDLTIQNNTFYRCVRPAVWAINFGWPADNNLVVTGNTFDFDTDNISASALRSIITLYVNGATVTGNTLTSSAVLAGYPYALIELNGASNYGIAGGCYNTVTGNTLNHAAGQLFSVHEVNGATGNVISNTETHV